MLQSFDAKWLSPLFFSVFSLWDAFFCFPISMPFLPIVALRIVERYSVARSAVTVPRFFLNSFPNLCSLFCPGKNVVQVFSFGHASGNICRVSSFSKHSFGFSIIVPFWCLDFYQFFFLTVHCFWSSRRLAKLIRVQIYQRFFFKKLLIYRLLVVRVLL